MGAGPSPLVVGHEKGRDEPKVGGIGCDARGPQDRAGSAPPAGAVAVPSGPRRPPPPVVAAAIDDRVVARVWHAHRGGVWRRPSEPPGGVR